MDGRLLELAEEPGLWLPPEPDGDVVVADGYSVVTYGRSVWVHRVRLEEGQVEAAVEEVRALLRGRGLDEVSWWAGAHTRPTDLPERLEALGLDELPALTTLTIASEPGDAPAVEVRRVETLDDQLAALEIDWTGFDVPEGERAERREVARAAWPLILAEGRTAVFLAYLDGGPVGFGRVVFTPWAGLLLGGATLPEARGRGVYTALVHARWREAVGRAVPRLVVAAGEMSAPILARLGFERIGGVRVLRDRL